MLCKLVASRTPFLERMGHNTHICNHDLVFDNGFLSICFAKTTDEISLVAGRSSASIGSASSVLSYGPDVV